LRWTPPIAAQDSAGDRGEIGSMVNSKRLVWMPVSLFRPGNIDSKALISNPLGIKGQNLLVRTMDRGDAPAAIFATAMNCELQANTTTDIMAISRTLNPPFWARTPKANPRGM